MTREIRKMECEIDRNSSSDGRLGGEKHSGRKRKLEKKWSIEEDLIMIGMIEERESIWNTCSPLYRNRCVKGKNWLEISERVDHSILDAKNRWNIIKSRYNSERHKEMESRNYQSRFELYKPLQFLSTISKKPIRIKNGENLMPKIEFQDTSYESPSSPATVYCSDPFSNHFENLDPDATYDSEIRETTATERGTRPSSLQSIPSQNCHRTDETRLNEFSTYLETNLRVHEEKGRWKRVFSEYIYCELDRYNNEDAQRLKNQLTRVCLEFQPTSTGCNCHHMKSNAQ